MLKVLTGEASKGDKNKIFFVEIFSFQFTLRLSNIVTYFQSIISFINVRMYVVSIPNVIEIVQTFRFVIRLILYR